MAIHEESGEIVATSMATHDLTWMFPFCGEVGWTAADPAHAGNGLGRAVVGAVTRRFLEAGYRRIHLYTETYRLAALKIYLSLGYMPLIAAPNDLELWDEICAQLQWPFSPEKWPTFKSE